MIETNYQISCDKCEAEGKEDPTVIHSQIEWGNVLLHGLWKHLRKAGWMRVDGQDWCPSCVRSISAEDPPKVRKPQAKKAPRLSKTARAALAQRMIDDE
jgi:hypothetical protein